MIATRRRPHEPRIPRQPLSTPVKPQHTRPIFAFTGHPQGPGAYDTAEKGSILQSSKSLRPPMTPVLDERLRKRVVTPGPGAYETMGANSSLNSQKGKFAKEDKSSKHQSLGPGPGAYAGECVSRIKPAKEVTSKHAKARINLFDMLAKQSVSPGPGAYSAAVTRPVTSGGTVGRAKRWVARPTAQSAELKYNHNTIPRGSSRFREAPSCLLQGRAKLELALDKDGNMATWQSSSALPTPGPNQYRSEYINTVEARASLEKGSGRPSSSFGTKRPSKSRTAGRIRLEMPGPTSYNPTDLKVSGGTTFPVTSRQGRARLLSPGSAPPVAVNQTPAPGYYDSLDPLSSPTISRIKRTPGGTIGKGSREAGGRFSGPETTSRSFEHLRGEQTPAPGTYDTVSATVGPAAVFSPIRKAPRCIIPRASKSTSAVLPNGSGAIGPGAYTPMQARPHSSHAHLSNTSREAAGAIVSPGAPPRIARDAALMPGPGQYSTTTSGFGRQALSSKGTAPSSTLGKQTREEATHVSNPEGSATALVEDVPPPSTYVTEHSSFGVQVTSKHRSQPGTFIGTSGRP